MERMKGFTLIEVVLVTAIIGVLLAVVVPRAWRANVDAKYGTLRQMTVAIGGTAQEWAQGQLNTQPTASTAILHAYFDTLVGSPGTDEGAPGYVSDPGLNWTGAAVDVDGRKNTPTGSDLPPTAVVRDLVAPDAALRNPFTGIELLRAEATAGNRMQQGALAAGWAENENGMRYYALIWHSSETIPPGNTDLRWYAGQGQTLAGLRNGVMFAQVRD